VNKDEYKKNSFVYKEFTTTKTMTMTILTIFWHFGQQIGSPLLRTIRRACQHDGQLRWRLDDGNE